MLCSDRSVSVINLIKVVNDTAEHGIALISDFNNSPTKNTNFSFAQGFLIDYIYFESADFRSANGFSELALVFEIFKISVFSCYETFYTLFGNFSDQNRWNTIQFMLYGYYTYLDDMKFI